MTAIEAREFPLSDADFHRIAALVRERTGIVLSERKRELVYGRLVRRLRALRLDSFASYCTLLDGPGGTDELDPMINAITTNLTAFFRESHHFEHLAHAVLQPRFAARSEASRRLRIWSAGCSSGEEPYSIAMVLHDALPASGGWDARILATDIDTDMVARAAGGHYPAKAAATVPPRHRARYLLRDGDGVTVAPALQSLITFKPLNLLEPWPMRGPFDVIFCRNVVIYFDKAEQRLLFDRFAELLGPEGWLYIGHSETLLGVSDRFAPAGRTIYRKVS